jgi:subtilisin family serine protease
VAEGRGRLTRRIGTVIVLAMMLASMFPSWQIGGAFPAQALPASQRGTERVIIEVARGANPSGVARALGVIPTHVYSEVFQGFAAELPAEAVRAINRQQGVLKIWPDLPVQAEAEGQVLPTGVDRVDADVSSWADIDEDGSSIDADVAVLDTGIAKHSELNIAGGKACVGKSTSDRNGHGTHVAGTIAAKDNTEGVVGVAPGARLWAVKVLDSSGSGRISSVICGLDWVYKHRATIDVINMSLSAPAKAEDQNLCESGKTTPLHRAICKVVNGGVTVVVAAGNGGKNATTNVPAAYDEVITVSAFTDLDGRYSGIGAPSCPDDVDDTFDCFSNFGEDIDIAAPGVSILSTWRRGNYARLSGTSMAAPHVTGAVALYIAKGPGPNTPEDVRLWLLTQASRPQDDPTYGFTGDPDPAAFHEPVLYLGST